MVGAWAQKVCMGRFIANIVVTTVAVFAGGLLTLCLLDSAPSQHQPNSRSAALGCASACGSHSQPAPFGVPADFEARYKEPLPPLPTWPQPPINLSLLYIAPVLAATAFAYGLKRQLLSVRLRM